MRAEFWDYVNLTKNRCEICVKQQEKIFPKTIDIFCSWWYNNNRKRERDTPKKLSKKIKKGIDKTLNQCYNNNRKGKGTDENDEKDYYQF